MAKHADKVVSLAELRFKPANSNDAARAVFAHHFVNVPHCSFAKDDGISHYLGSETGMETFPASPDVAAPQNVDVPAIQGETPQASGSLRRKLLRGGFGLSIFLHAAAAIAFGFAVIAPPDDVAQEEGVLSVTFVVEGNADADARAAGAEEEVKDQEDRPVEKAAVKPVEKEPVKPVEEEPLKPVEKVAEKQPEIEKPVHETAENILKDVPMPVLGTDTPEILTAKIESEAKTEVVSKPLPTEKKIEPPVEKQVTPVVVEKPVEKQPVVKPVEKKPEEKPKPLEKKPEEKKEKPKKQPEKDRPREKRKQNKGNQGNQTNDAKKGEVDSDNKGKASTNSRGDAANRDIGNASRSNYKGLVNKKLARSKGRIQGSAKGKVTVTFTIMANGTVSGLRISNSSGKAALDAAALKVVRNASPFPAIPAETGKKSWLMTVSMTFK